MYVKEKTKKMSEGRIRVCNVFNKTYTIKKIFNLHMKTVHKEQKINKSEERFSSPQKKSFTCMQCEKQFPRNSHLKRHLKLLHENTPKQIGRPLKDKKDLSAKNKFMCCRTHVLTS